MKTKLILTTTSLVLVAGSNVFAASGDTSGSDAESQEALA